MDIERLRQIPLFAALDDNSLRAISALAAERSIGAGDVIVEEGDFSYNEFFVIAEGTVEVVRGGEAIAELGVGDFFGETAVLQKEKRGATVRAKDQVRLIMLTGWDLKRLQKRSPDTFGAIQAKIAERAPASPA